VGVTVDHIDRPSLLDGEINAVYTYGLALHPLPGRPELVSVTAEGSHRDGDDRIDLVYGIRLLDRRGLELSLVVRDDNGEEPYLGAGATVYLDRAGVEGGFRRVAAAGPDWRWHGAVQAYDDHWRRARAPRERMVD
jgi:hypothetical protein